MGRFTSGLAVGSTVDRGQPNHFCCSLLGTSVVEGNTVKVKVYLAGYFNTRARLRPIRDKINDMGGYEVVSSWLSERPSEEEGLNVLPDKDKFPRYAKRDFAEINMADMLIVDTFDVTERGGREVEYGYAYGKGKKVWLVGPTRNVFHFLAHREFTNWGECLQALKELWLEKEGDND